MRPYAFPGIVCNGRQVLIGDIMNRSVIAAGNFEHALFEFIRQWLGGTGSFLLRTSGSTGSPKTINITRRQMIASARLTSQALHLRRGQTSLICLNPDFIAGKMMIVRSLETDLAIIAVNPASNPLKQVSQPVDFAAMVPLQVHELLHTHMGAFRQLGTVIIGGGAIDTQDLDLLRDLPCKFYATYGMTETVSHVALRQLNGVDASSHFKALPGITFSLDPRGCLIIRWPELGDPVVTNDLVELADDERFTWLGRWDNVINSGGIKIIPEKLEAAITSVLKGVGHRGRFFVSSVPDARLGRKVVMVIEGDPMNQIYSNLQETLKSSLQSHEMPKELYFCQQFTETQTGKVNRNATLELVISTDRLTD